jgi:hypothetical protein
MDMMVLLYANDRVGARPPCAAALPNAKTCCVDIQLSYDLVPEYGESPKRLLPFASLITYRDLHWSNRLVSPHRTHTRFRDAIADRAEIDRMPVCFRLANGATVQSVASEKPRLLLGF